MEQGVGERVLEASEQGLWLSNVLGRSPKRNRD